jgi:isopropylmalate/homocitrate/citramalate synthase
LITICEVGPRDGLQNERDIVPPEMRAELVNRLAEARLPVVEAVSFVSADRARPADGLRGRGRRQGSTGATAPLRRAGP